MRILEVKWRKLAKLNINEKPNIIINIPEAIDAMP
jgi:hypothetical protein